MADTATATGAAPYVIPQEPVLSSNLAAIGYDLERQVMAITFKSGDIWHYGSIPIDLARDWFEAESKGQFYTAYVKGKFPAEKMTGVCPQCGDLHGHIGTVCGDCGTATYVREERKEPTRG